MSIRYEVHFLLNCEFGDDYFDVIHCHNLLKAVKIAYNLIKQQGYDHVYIEIYNDRG